MQMNAVDRTVPQKLYCQVIEILKRNITSGDWKVGSQIPTEDQLCNHYNVSKATIRLAIAELSSQGLLKKFQGKGTFVRRRRPEHRITMLMPLGEEGICRNSAYLTRVIDNRIISPDDRLRDHLNLSTDRCACLSRMLIADGMPYLMQKLFTPYDLPPDFTATDEAQEASAYAIFESVSGKKIHRVREMVDVTAAPAAETKLLEIEPHMPLLRVRHVCFSVEDTAIGLSESLYRTDVCAKTSEFERMQL